MWTHLFFHVLMDRWMDGGSTRTFRGNVASDSLSLSFEQCGVYGGSFVRYFFHFHFTSHDAVHCSHYRFLDGVRGKYILHNHTSTHTFIHKYQCIFWTGQEFLFIVYDTYVSLSMPKQIAMWARKFCKRNYFVRYSVCVLESSCVATTNKMGPRISEREKPTMRWTSRSFWMWQIKAQLNKLHELISISNFLVQSEYHWLLADCCFLLPPQNRYIFIQCVYTWTQIWMKLLKFGAR